MVHGAESMLPELMAQNEAAGPMFKMADDPRVTRVGQFLRKTSIDELPQLINVVKGDMSLVGPRPALPHEAVQWNDDLKERLRVKPGMTGNWQVNGRFTASMEDYQRLDLYYVDNWSAGHGPGHPGQDDPRGAAPQRRRLITALIRALIPRSDQMLRAQPG